ncbi:MAG TPA: hypothetical protein VJJ81_03550 [Candidatus Babeliales bacterium]|nr:hypothetical protein [Candidatus Babeliales bacterium]
MKRKFKLVILLLNLILLNNISAIPHYFCTCADNNFFDRVIRLIDSINKNDHEFVEKILVFDLGFTKPQELILKQKPHVYLRALNNIHPNILRPFKTDTNRFVRGWFAWKPVAIKQALEECPYILYADSAVEVFKPLDDLFQYIIQEGYFLMDTDSHPIEPRLTKKVRDELIKHFSGDWQLAMLDHDTKFLAACIQGLTRQVLDSYVLPVYKLTSNLELFQDDGTAPMGFGSGRHDQTLFSIFARLNGMRLHRPGWLNIQLNRKSIPIHVHWDINKINKYSCLKF